MLRVLLTVTFVYNYYIIIIIIIFFLIWILALERGMHPSPLSAPPAIFTGWEGLFFAGRGGGIFFFFFNKEHFMNLCVILAWGLC